MTPQTPTSWRQDLQQWLGPFLEALRHKKQARWAPFYLHGLLAQGRGAGGPRAAGARPTWRTTQTSRAQQPPAIFTSVDRGPARAHGTPGGDLS